MEQIKEKRNAVFVAAGKDSLHRQLLSGNADFDLHLLVYDDSYDKFCHDTDFIYGSSGYKMDMTYRYLQQHPSYLDEYEYFFLMDDDVRMTTEEVNKLFMLMRKYNLKIAQPSLLMSYYTYSHTANHPLCVLRYTNFVEMMVPCFSKEALRRVLPTFKRQVRGCGIEMHWPVLIEVTHRDMAIIDAVHAVHTRPLQPWSKEDHANMLKYLADNHLDWSIEEYSSVPLHSGSRWWVGKTSFDRLRHLSKIKTQQFFREGLCQMKISDAMPVLSFLWLNSLLWNDRKCWDVAERLLGKLREIKGKNHI